MTIWLIFFLTIVLLTILICWLLAQLIKTEKKVKEYEETYCYLNDDEPYMVKFTKAKIDTKNKIGLHKVVLAKFKSGFYDVIYLHIPKKCDKLSQQRYFYYDLNGCEIIEEEIEEIAIIKEW